MDRRAKILEDRFGIAVNPDKFISWEGAKSADYPMWWINDPDNPGRHIIFCEYDNEYYLCQTACSTFKKPIPFSTSGRNNL